MNRPQPPFPPLLAVLGLLLATWFSLTQTASAVFLPPDHSDLFAATLSPAEHQEANALTPENRVWENFGNANEITPADELNSLQLRWESHFGELELASGVLSYADGNPISLSDPFGLCAGRNACTGGYGTGNSPYWDPVDIDWEMASMAGHGTLDAVGLVPGFGEPADGINGLWYAAEGNAVDSGLSFAGMIPFAGWAATGGKVLRHANEVVDLAPTLNRIDTGGSFPHRNDGSTFGNREGILPQQPNGYYTEFVHPTPGVSGPGAQRIVQGQGGERYYTPDHYKTFMPLDP